MGEGDNRESDGWMAPPNDGHEFEQALGDGEGQSDVMQFIGSQIVRHN